MDEQNEEQLRVDAAEAEIRLRRRIESGDEFTDGQIEQIWEWCDLTYQKKWWMLNRYFGEHVKAAEKRRCRDYRW